MRPDINDLRTPAQRVTHTIFVVGYDPFLSRWGRAQLGTSFAAWACEECNVEAVEEWVGKRNDVRDAVTVDEDDFDDNRCVHLSIYPVANNHPAIGG